MHNVVKEAFLLIMMVTIAALMYFVLFGSWDNKAFYFEGNDAGVVTKEDGHVTKQTWQGVLWYSARTVENPIAFYYYNYCLTPNVHGTDYLDIELGCKPYGQTNPDDITVANYRNQDASVVDAENYPTYYPSEFSGSTDAVVSFGTDHYYYKDRLSDF